MAHDELPFPIDRYFTLNDVLVSITKCHASSTYIEYWRSPEDEHPVALSYSQVDKIATNLAYRLDREFKIKGKPVGFLADHSVQYAFYLLALLKLECRTMLLSPRNSESTLVHLMNKTDTKTLLFTSRFSKISARVIDELNGASAQLASEVNIDQVLQEDPDIEADLTARVSTQNDLKNTALIIHSSGTTGHPKPIYLSNQYLILLIQVYSQCFSGIASPKLLSLAPLFHVMGTVLLAAAIIGATYTFPTNFPPLSDTITYSIRKSGANCLISPPILLETLAERLKTHKEEVPIAKQLKLAFFGGAALQGQAGKYLIDLGINVKSGYGATEFGVAAFADEDPNCKDFSSMRFLISKDNYEWEETDVDSNAKHLIIKASSPFLATGVSNRPDGSYATNDLWRPNPSKPGYWNNCGRADDTLIMSNGEKTNPIPMEAAIRNYHQVISNCAVIGHGKSATAAVIQLNVNVAMTRDLYDILNIVEAAVDVANRDAPSHSKIIFPNMVKVLPLNQTLPVTDKGTVSRKKVEQFCAEYITHMYQQFFEKSSEMQQDKGGNSKLVRYPTSVTNFLKTTVAGLLKTKPDELDTGVNVFDQGLDSLLVVQLRNSIVKNVCDVPTNFVFQNSTIESMVQSICAGQVEGGVVNAYEQTLPLLSKYIKRIDEFMPMPAHSFQTKAKGGEVVILTGSTGSLGALILQGLLSSTSVKKVYALVRGKNGIERLHKSFQERSLDTSLLQSSKLQTYALDLTQIHLGLTVDQYNGMQAEATMICHCAWMLDFLQPVTYYEKECISGLFHLLLLAYRSGVNAMRVHFISSVSASMAMKGIVEESPLPGDPTCAAPMGYAQSKFIAEHLIKYVTKQKNIPGFVERVGQMSGDTVKGYWNPQEQYPLMVAGGAVHMHKMPTLDAQIDWIPLDYSAASIIEIMNNTANMQPSCTESIFHIVNPNRATWNDFLEALRANGLKFDTVSPEEWIKDLSEDDTNPGFKLISFYEDVFGNVSMPVWQTNKTEAVSHKLKTTPKIDPSLVQKYLQYWHNIQFLA